MFINLSGIIYLCVCVCLEYTSNSYQNITHASSESDILYKRVNLVTILLILDVKYLILLETLQEHSTYVAQNCNFLNLSVLCLTLSPSQQRNTVVFCTWLLLIFLFLLFCILSKVAIAVNNGFCFTPD